MTPEWPQYLHHVTLHFPIVASLLLAIVGLWHLRDDAVQLRKIVRWLGWATLLLTTVAVISGLLAAPEPFGDEVPEVLGHHRNLGITTWCAMLTAAVAYELGVRRGLRKLRMFGALCWVAVAFAAVGAGHWGGSSLHSDKIPWQGQPPVLGPDRQ